LTEGQTAKESFQTAKEGFDRQVEALSQDKSRAAQALEYAFDFMEAAFAAGEEMVIFVTELTLASDSALFLSEYRCERYQKYNQELLIGSRRRELLSELHDRNA
jgi:hypothetical protein